MTPILGFLVVLAIAFISVQFVIRRVNQRNPFIGGFLVSGIPYIVLGFLLGPSVFDFLNKETLISLEPFISLALGWIGMLFGIQFRWRNIRRFPQNYVFLTSIQSLISFFLISLLSLGMLIYFQGNISKHLLEVAFILGALGSITAPITIARTISTYKARGRLTHLIQFISGLDAFWGILATGIVLSFFHIPSGAFLKYGWEWFITCISVGTFLGLLFQYLMRNWFNQEEVFLLVIGMVIFTSGIGYYLHVSSIFLNMIVGIVLAQYRRESEKIIRVLISGEQPIYVILLIFAGAMWSIPRSFTWLLIVGFILFRFVGKYVGGAISAKYVNCAFHIPPNIGTVLTSFGGISLAIAFNFKLFDASYMGNLVLSATIVGIMLFDEYAAWSTVRLLKKQGEIP